jgi:hypothetical protein
MMKVDLAEPDRVEYSLVSRTDADHTLRCMTCPYYACTELTIHSDELSNTGTILVGCDEI